MNSVLIAAALFAAGMSLAQAADPAPLPKSSIEVFHIAPGQHENLLKTSAQAAELLYTLDATATLTSVDIDWDYVKMEPKGSRLFMARDKPQ